MSNHAAAPFDFGRNRSAPWRPRAEDLGPLALIVLLPLLLAAPQLLGWFDADPVLAKAALTIGAEPRLLPGEPYNDFNYAWTTHALGYRAALDWIAGEVPWWNPFSGVGLPLAAEYQPAAFFPLTLLLLLPQGMAWEHLVLQVLAGWGCYALLRQLGLARLAATTGGLLYAFDGTLALIASGPAMQVPFLPWMLLGIERARACAANGMRGGWRLFALAMAMNLAAGFPETAYICGLMALAWAMLRLWQIGPARRAAFAWRVALGGSVGLFLVAPQILAFFISLSDSYIGMHAGRYGDSALEAVAAVPSLLTPWVFGPIYAYVDRWPLVQLVASELGGYVTLAVLVMAAFGLLVRRRALCWLLFAWCVVTLAKSFGLEPALSMWNLLPGIADSAFGKYAQPTWELAFIILAAFGLDDLAEQNVTRSAALRGAAVTLMLGVGILLAVGAAQWPNLKEHVGLRNWAAGSALWALLTAAGCILLMKFAAARWRARAIAALLVLDSMLMFAIPTLSNLRGGTMDLAAVSFLREHLGLQRFYSLGPVQPNYSAYFGVASVNHNYMPVSTRWTDWVQAHLDRGARPIEFIGDLPRESDKPKQRQELARNLAEYEWVGVKYVVAWSGVAPFEAAHDQAGAVQLAYRDQWISIYELPAPKSYFETVGSRCAVHAQQRTVADVRCDGPAVLVRRELSFPGWTATVNGQATPVATYRDLFQSIDLPAGATAVRFSYSPPYMGWGWFLMCLGLFALAAPTFAKRSRRGGF
jgi:hypothetical protein